MRGQRRPARPRWLPAAAIGAVVLVTALSRIPHLGTGELDFDEGVYWLSLRSLRAGHAFATEVYSSQPPAFLLGLQPAWAWLGGTIEAARALMTGWGCVAVVAAGVSAWRLAGAWTGVAAAVLTGVDPRLVDQSVTLQADGPATALGLVALAAAALAATARGRRSQAVAAAAAGALLVAGVLTKLFDAGLLPALAVALVLGGRWRLRAVAATAGGALMAAVVLLPLHDAWGAMWSQAVSAHLDTRSLDSGFGAGYLAALARPEWAVMVVAAAGLLTGWWAARRLWVVSVAWCGGAVAMLVATHPLFQHHAVLLMAGMVLMGASAVASVARAGRAVVQAHAQRGAALLAAGAGIIAAVVLLEPALAPLHATVNTARVQQVAAFVPPAALVVTDDQFDVAAASRDSPPRWVDTSGVRIIGSDVSAADLEASLAADPEACAVLFQSGRLTGLPGFVAWAAARYPQHVVLDGGAVLDIRPGCPA